LDLVKSASEEILWIFPTANALIRQEKIGAIQLAKEAARERNVRVRILVPANTLIEQKMQQLKEHCSSSSNDIIDARYIAQMSETKATILVIDRKASLVMELKDDSKTTFIEAIGLSTYSNSKAGVSSYVAIFENLWKQTELYDQLKEAHEQLKTHDKMQEEFINIAAHELRTPIQPILGLTQVLRCNIKDPKQCELLDITIRNAKRLQRLTEDILNVTKIESQSLNLNKERFNLKDVISNAIDDIMTNMQSSSTTITNNNNGAINLVYHQPQDVFIYADKGRISQVVSNLLDNAVKFTKDGDIITVIIENRDNNNQQQIVISVNDEGTGIDSQIFRRLFTKFATKSQTRGTGLGLFICKGIVEAHGGKIWAENNPDGKGATFSFSLPLVNNNNM
jgi:two-component system, OmpR family, sensor histidine kinase VicK